MDSGLFGIQHSNRTVNEHWGKNCFNSSFPASVACYMLANNIPAIYIYLDQDNNGLYVRSGEIPISKVFNCGINDTSSLSFNFECIFDPYQQYSFDPIDNIDLVLKNLDGTWLSPLEVKLTVLPTDQTSRLPENKWGCELVVRTATTSYCALGMFDSVKDSAENIREIFENVCSAIQMWDNNFEMCHKMPFLCQCINVFQNKHYMKQKPLVMQTIWKTQGKSPLLDKQAFDIVVWSDYAFSRLFIDRSSENMQEMSRYMRATARLARCLWELSKSGKIRLADIYRQMAFDNQTDKEFAIGASLWRRYVTSERVITPILPKTVVNDIIKPGYIQRLSPERRFDQTLYFTMKLD